MAVSANTVTELNGKEMTLREICSQYSLNLNTVRYRYKAGHRDTSLIKKVNNLNPRTSKHTNMKIPKAKRILLRLREGVLTHTQIADESDVTPREVGYISRGVGPWSKVTISDEEIADFEASMKPQMLSTYGLKPSKSILDLALLGATARKY